MLLETTVILIVVALVVGAAAAFARSLSKAKREITAETLGTASKTLMSV